MQRWATIVVFVILSASARAEDKAAEARARYEQGLNYYNLAKYDQAIEEFKAAYTITIAPGFLFNIAQAYRLKGDCTQALQFYKDYLREDPDAPNSKKVNERIAEMEKCAVPKEVPLESDLEKSAPETPAETPVETPVPEATSEPPTPAPETAVASVNTVPIRERKSGRIKKIAGIGAIVAGLALGATGAFYSYEAMRASDEVTELFNDGGEWDNNYENRENWGKRAEKLSIGFYAAGGAAVVTGCVLAYLGARQDRLWERRLASVKLSPLPRGAALTWSF